MSLHAAVIAVGFGGGAAYRRLSGREVAPATIVFDTTSQPMTTSSVVTASAEPERTVESERPAEPVETPVFNGDEVEMPEMPAAELAAEAARSRSVPEATALDQVMGDTRSSWKLASLAHEGLQFGLASTPPVSDCCGEPQPPPHTPVASEVYLYPEVVSMARAEYPVKSQRMAEEGSVVLEMTVGDDGLVKEVKVEESSGYLRLDDCAVAAARQWVFKPATRNGVPEASVARHRYTFRLTGSGG